jgi:hypothetical protein
MSDQQSQQNQKAVQTTPPAAPAATLDATAIQQLVQVLLLDQQERAIERQEAKKEKEEKLKQWTRKNNQRILIAQAESERKFKSYELCTHRKGGKGLPGPKVDYAVSFHTFPDQSSYIRCLVCGFKWRNTDTESTIVRRGVSIDNPTGIGWKGAYQMIKDSSNTATSCEVQLNTSPVAVQAAKYIGDPEEDRLVVEL